MLVKSVLFNLSLPKLYIFLSIFIYDKQNIIFYNTLLSLVKSALCKKFTDSLLLILLIAQR